MRVSTDTLTGLQMIYDRYYFGMFTGSQEMDVAEESREHFMRDALVDAIKVLNEQVPRLFEPEAVEGGSRGGTITAPDLPEIDIRKDQ